MTAETPSDGAHIAPTGPAPREGTEMDHEMVSGGGVERRADADTPRFHEKDTEIQRLREANRRLQAEGPALERDKLIVALRAELAALRVVAEAAKRLRDQDQYEAVLVQDEEGDWIARHPDLPGCLADGPTPEKAREEWAPARWMWLAENVVVSLGSLERTEGPPPSETR